MAQTGVEALDAELGGGLPRGHLSEIVGSRSTGRTGLLCALLSAATVREELVALVDTFDRFDPESGAAAGIDLSRMLWVRGRAGGRDETVSRTVGRAIKALGLLLHAGGFGVVALDLADVPTSALRRIPFTTWMRVARAIEGQKTVCVMLGAAPIARSAGGMTLTLQADASSGRWVGDADTSVPSRKSGDKFSGARRPAGKARRPSISGICEEEATPSGGMPRPEIVSGFPTRDTRLFQGLEVNARVICARRRSHDSVCNLWLTADSHG